MSPPTGPVPADPADDDAGARRVLEGTLDRITFHSEATGYTVARLVPRGKDHVVTIVGAIAGVSVGASLKLWGQWTTHAQYGRQFAVEDYVEQLPATIEGIRKYLGSGLIRGVGPVTADRIVDHFALETLEIIEHAPGRLHEVPGVGEMRVRQIIHAWQEQQQIKEIMLFLQAHGIATGLAVRIFKHYGTQAIGVVRDDPYRMAREVFGIGFKTADRIARQMGIAPDSPRRLDAGVLFTLSELADDGHTFAGRAELAEEAARRLTVDDPGPPGPVAADVPAREATPDRAVDGVDPDVGPPRPPQRDVRPGMSTGAIVVPREAVAVAIDRLAGTGEVRIEWTGGAGVRTGGGTEGYGRGMIGETTGAYAVRGAAPAVVSGAPAAPDPGDAVYLPPFYYAEIGVAGRVRRLLGTSASRLGAFRGLDWEVALGWVDRRSPYPLAARQREAVRAALTNKVTVLTGGPGTGKTTTVRAVLQLLDAKGGSVRLCAPTGRAAKRLAEATGKEARTIHRLLEFKPSEGRRFQRDEDRPLDADLVVVDEVSMVDLVLMNDLTRAIHPSTHLLVVGDVDQLPSVGAGNVLRDLIDSGVVPTVALDQIFRQDAGSYIVTNAHRINQGLVPLFEKDSTDFFLFPAEDGQAAADRVVDVVTARIPRRFGLDPVRDVQVLSPMHRGPAGVGALNERLQAALNPPADDRVEVRLGGRVFRDGDKVMQIRNNYDKDVFNGDLGRIEGVNRVDQVVRIDFDGTGVDYEFAEMDEVVHAFACSTHKSQGAEYPAVVMALVPAHYMLLQRNLLYTGVTRARRLCVLVGSRRAIATAVRNDEVARRNSGLAARLAAPDEPRGPFALGGSAGNHDRREGE
jgi:exodeoxyribonuclease V alpha subunit